MLTEMGADYFSAKSSSAFSFCLFEGTKYSETESNKDFTLDLQVGALKIEDLSNISINYTKKQNPKLNTKKLMRTYEKTE